MFRAEGRGFGARRRDPGGADDYGCGPAWRFMGSLCNVSRENP